MLLHDGTYRRVKTTTLKIDKGITVESVNGKDKAVLVGSEGEGEARGIEISHADAILRGVTLRGFSTKAYGTASGVSVSKGAVENCNILACDAIGCKAAGVVVKDGGRLSDSLIAYCTIPDGAYDRRGAGVFLYSGTVSHCEIVSNVAPYAAGIAMNEHQSLVTDCTIRHNRSFRGANHYEDFFGNLGRGAGVCMDKGRIERSIIEGNEGDRAAGLHVIEGTVWNCLIRGTRALNGPCGGVYSKNGHLQNVTIQDNFSYIGSGVDLSMEGGTATNLLVYSPGYAPRCAPVVGSGAKIGSSAFTTEVPGENNIVIRPSDLDPVSLTPYPGSPVATGFDFSAVFNDDLEGSIRPASFGMGSRVPYAEADGPIVVSSDKTDGKSPLAITFEARVGGSAASDCHWSFGDDGESVGSRASHLFTTPGRHLVTATLPDGRSTRYPVFVAGRTIAYVSGTGSNQFPYDTPEKAATSIQAALDVIEATPGIQGEVRIAPGVYSETDGDQSREWLPMVSVIGNIRLVGLGSSREEVSLDGGGLRPVLHVGHPGAIIENLTVRNGRVRLQKYKAANLFLLDGTVTNCLIEKGYGGCYGNVSVGNGVLRDCEIRNGKVDDGGEGNVSGGVNVFGPALVENCMIHDNMGNYGGGLFVADSAFAEDAVVRRCLIAGNGDKGNPVTGCGGGGAVLRAGVLERCVITNNVTMKNGGGVSMDAKESRAVLRNCLVAGNVAKGNLNGFGYHEGGGGGGVSLRSGTIEHCTIHGNRTAVSTGQDLFLTGGLVRNTIVSPADRATGALSVRKDGGRIEDSCLPSSVDGAVRVVVGDPVLEAPPDGKFGLLPGSPCLDVAAPLGHIAEDIEGCRRPIGEGSDLGCHEMTFPSGEFLVTFQIDRSEATEPFDATLTAEPLNGHGAIRYEWDFGDGSTERTTSPSVSHHFGYGSHTVVLIAIDEAGATASIERAGCVNVASSVAYVSETGSATWPFETWEKATPVVQDAIDAVYATSENPGTVYMAKGTYKARSEDDSFVAVLQRPVRLIGTDGRHTAVLDAEGWPQRRVVSMDHPRALLDNIACANGRYDEKVYFPGPGLWLTDGVVSNVAVYGCEGGSGAVSMWGGRFTDGVISNCVSATGHRWDRHGGGAHLRGGILQRTSIDHCASGYGGGVYLFGDKAIVRDCSITDCDTYAGGVIYISCGLLENSIIRGNRNNCASGYDSKGIALYARQHQGSSLIRNCLIVDNTGFEKNLPQYGVYLSRGATLVNCTVWGNRNEELNGPAHGILNDGSKAFNSIAPSIDGNGQGAANYTGTAPRFSNEAKGNYHLSSASPCIDAGDGSHWSEVTPLVDLEGKPRFHGASVDLGPYEFCGRVGTLLMVR